MGVVYLLPDHPNPMLIVLVKCILNNYELGTATIIYTQCRSFIIHIFVVYIPMRILLYDLYKCVSINMS
jgi:hypothetical protein